ncbi:hypothetical protein N8T08_005577 [Aspergillus melleus]|uniref:Uncharacterized protein n=1 Tax=Aspergillus melleus TaxID=138277 RepID=A0ACC3B329_9EURO|nr:hypothetical protein N8T08_005577 [Aspergillus melleus]
MATIKLSRYCLVMVLIWTLLDNYGHTALQKAAENVHERIAGILLENGASVGIQNNDDRAALQLAAENGHQNVVEILEKHVKSGGKLGSVGIELD